MHISESPHYKYANQTLNWLPSDTEERYRHNLKHQYDQLNKFNWIDTQLTYKFNSDGFRCDEFTNDPSIVFLGCSLTQGIGLPVETIWPTLVSRQLNLKCFNLGICGSSNDTAFRLAFTWLEKIKPVQVILCTPSSERLELLSHTWFKLLPQSKSSFPGVDFYKHWTTNGNNGFLNKTKNTFAIQHLCDQFNIKLTIIDSHTFFSTMRIDLARDLDHPGIESNLKFSEYVLNRVY